ncbi:uncharacterized protein LTHEOB_1696 [Lasiodiplodia theobromae]|uniref:uncharacterized protein n=1 Tax=Lasiodiplodia theobromae TaxID=45133 RepID=UPI0015C38727|nr:uncharacterized protein LTHEOB_1696 [Lasiodiplodia theobromae]KAF4537505.1 hypothetical protein LTHEOB_1696 [Lasiodiplodia theobromae]
MSPPLGATEGHGEATDREPGAVAEFALQRERIVANSRSSDYLDDTTNQPQRIKDESDSEDDEGSEENGLRVFYPRPSLPVPSVEHRSLQNLMEMLEQEVIDLNPEYQRDVVWAQERMIGLIDSLIENVCIPPIIFNRQITRMEDGTARVKRVCVDGKQRLSSLKAFMEGRIGCHDRHGSIWYFTKPAASKRRRTVPEHFKEAFRNRKLIVYEYRNLKRAQEEDLFSSVQKGVQLTTAEKLRATTGPWQELGKIYERDFPKVSGLSGTRRAVGFNNVLVSFGMIIEAERGLSNQKAPHFSTSASTIKALFKNVDDYNADMREKIRQTYMAFDWLIELDPKAFMDNGYTHAKLFSPFEFVATTVLISLHSENESDQFLLESIKGMRLHL